MNKPTEAFDLAAEAFIQDIWRKRESPIIGREADYPGRVTRFVQAQIDGDEKIFKVTIRELIPQDATPAESLTPEEEQWIRAWLEKNIKPPSE